MINYFVNIIYYKEGDSLCADDLKKDPYKVTTVSINKIVSISKPVMFRAPFSNNAVKKYSTVYLMDGVRYIISQGEYEILISKLNII